LILVANMNGHGPTRSIANYLDGQFSKSRNIYAEVLAVDAATAIVADTSGHLTCIDLQSMQPTIRLYVGHEAGVACKQLRTLSRFLDDPRFLVATQGGYAVWCDVQRKQAFKIFPKSDAPVSATAFLFNDIVILGLGSFSLSGCNSLAALEIWQVKPDGVLSFHAFVSLPGCCVERIAVSPDFTEIACWTGNRLQNTGHLIRLETNTLHARSHDEFSVPFCGTLSYVHSDGMLGLLASTQRKAIRARIDVEERVCDEFAFEDAALTFALDAPGDHALFSNGLVLKVSDNELAQVGTEPLPEECTGVAAHPHGGFLAVSARGSLWYRPQPIGMFNRSSNPS
jgi:hypothetical protein